MFGQTRAVGLMFLPAREDVVKSSTGLLPLNLFGVLRRESLRLHNERLPLSEGSRHHCQLLSGLFLGDLLDSTAECLEPRHQRREVADRVRGGDRGRQGGDGFRYIRHRRSALDSLLKQRHLPRELGELALKVPEGFVGRSIGVLADRPLDTLCVAHEDSARLVDSTPGGLIVTRQNHHLAVRGHSVLSDRLSAYCTVSTTAVGLAPRHSARYCRVTEVIVVGMAGSPSAGTVPSAAGATPPDAICATNWSSPPVTAPTTL